MNLRLLNSFLTLFVLATFAIFIFQACDLPEHYFSSKPECQNQDDYFNSANSQSSEYQSKVINLLSDSEAKDFRYFFITFLEEGQQTYMLTNFRNEEHCFDVKVLVENWDKLAGMRRVNGKSYPNELYDLKWSIITLNGQQFVYYVDMHDIID